MVLKNSRGITLSALVITIVVLAILASVGTLASIKLLVYTKENEFITELTVIEEKVRIISKEIALGSEAYDEFGMEISDLDAAKQAEVQIILTQSGVINSSGYKYFDSEELEKLGIVNMNHNVLLNLRKNDVVSADGIKVGDNMYYTISDVENARAEENEE